MDSASIAAMLQYLTSHLITMLHPIGEVYDKHCCVSSSASGARKGRVRVCRTTVLELLLSATSGHSRAFEA